MDFTKESHWNTAELRIPGIFFSEQNKPSVVVWPLAIEQAIKSCPYRVRVLKPMAHSVSVIIPKSSGGKDNTAWRDELRDLMINLVGGASWIDQEGAYISRKTGEQVQEPSWLVIGHMSQEALYTSFPTVLAFVGKLLNQLEEEAIAMQVNNRMFYVEKDS